MSEELLQTTPKKIGRYTYYRLGNTTLEQLKDHGIVPKRNYGNTQEQEAGRSRFLSQRHQGRGGV